MLEVEDIDKMKDINTRFRQFSKYFETLNRAKMLDDVKGFSVNKPVSKLTSGSETMPLQLRVQHAGPPLPPTQDPQTLFAQESGDISDKTIEMVMENWDDFAEPQSPLVTKKRKTDDSDSL